MKKLKRAEIFALVVIIVFSAIYTYTSLRRSPAPEPYINLGFNGKVPPEIIVGDTTKKQAIFTFDCGGSADSADAILKALAKHHVRGTFFMTGMFATKYSDVVKRIHAEGHEIFNHTDRHPHLTELSDGEIRHELAKLDMTVMSLTGSSTAPYFRAPYGDRDARVLAAAAQLGFRSVYWSDDALDWEESKGMTSREVHDRILANLKPGAIYLMHVGDTITGAILDGLFTNIEARGYKVVSLTQGL